MTTVTIRESKVGGRAWTSRHRTDDRDEAITRAIRRVWGARADLQVDASLAAMTGPDAQYGQIIRTLTPRERGSGSTWAATVLTGRVHVRVEAPDAAAR